MPPCAGNIEVKAIVKNAGTPAVPMRVPGGCVSDGEGAGLPGGDATRHAAAATAISA